MTSWPEVLQVLKGLFPGDRLGLQRLFGLHQRGLRPHRRAQLHGLRAAAQIGPAGQNAGGHPGGDRPRLQARPTSLRRPGREKKNDPLEEFAAMAENAGVTVAKIKTEE